MKKVVSFLTAIVMSVALFAGCSNTTASKTNLDNFKKTTPDTYPIETDETLTYWLVASGHTLATHPSQNETRLSEELTERTGIKVEYIHPIVGQESEQFNLMLSSGELPDIIEYGWAAKYPGGVEKAIQENMILPLDNVMKEASPNIIKIFEENPEVAKLAKTNGGNYYGYPMLMLDGRLQTFRGPMVREDLLKKAGLDIPVTVDDWDKMLRAFKDLGVETPLTLKLTNALLDDISPFLAAYGITGGFFADNGVVKFGPYEPAFKDFVTLLTNWYSDGLLDKNFTDTDTKRVTALVSSGQCGSAFGSAGGDFGTWIPLLQENQPDAKFVPVTYPVKNAGDKPMVGQKTFPVAATVACISATSKNVELAARFLDYGYTDEGHMLYNFGVDGESYTMVGDVPTYTDIITDDTKNGGLGIGAAMGKYIRASSTGPFVQDINYLLQFYAIQEQKDALNVWSDTDALEYRIPTGIMTTEENKEYSKIMSDIDVYREEFLYKVVTGRSSLDEFETYYAKLKDFGMERAIEIYQQAYDRYTKK